MKTPVLRIALVAIAVASTITLRPGVTGDQKLDRALRDVLASPGPESFRVFVRGRENHREVLNAVADQHAQVLQEQSQLQTVTAQVSRSS